MEVSLEDVRTESPMEDFLLMERKSNWNAMPEDIFYTAQAGIMLFNCLIPRLTMEEIVSPLPIQTRERVVLGVRWRFGLPMCLMTFTVCILFMKCHRTELLFCVQQTMLFSVYRSTEK